MRNDIYVELMLEWQSDDNQLEMKIGQKRVRKLLNAGQIISKVPRLVNAAIGHDFYEDYIY